MKIEQIVLENFGCYTRKSFQLGSAPLVLIYGPNESGKTTALNGLRQALFGFRPRTPYLTGRTMQAELRARMADGRELEFSRKKSRQDDVSGTLDRKRLPAEEIRALLCDLDLDSYEQLFGFSLEELRRGETALKSARLTDALAGGGLGGITALQQLRTDLDQSLAELYKSRGSTSRINVKLAEIDQSHEALRATQTLPSAVDALREQLRAEQQRSEQLKDDYAQLFQQRAIATRTLEALPQFRQRQQILTQLAGFDVPDGVDMTVVAQWSDYADRLRALRQRSQTETEQLRQEQQQLEQLGTSHDLLEFERDIEQLGHAASEITALRQRMQELRDQGDDANAMCQRLLENLELAEVNARLRDFALSAPARRELESLSSQFVAANDEIVQVTAKLEAARESLQAVEGIPDQEMLPENIPQLSSLVTRLADSESEFAQRSATLKQLSDDAEFSELAQRLVNQLNGMPPLHSDWPVPSVAAITEQAQSRDELQRQETLIQTRVSDLQRKCVSIRQELEQPASGSLATVHLQQSQELQQQRDDLIARWLDDLAEPLIAASLSPSEQQTRLQRLQELLSQGDALHTQLLAAADQLAAHHQKCAHLQTLEQELAAALDQQKELVGGRQAWDAKWRELWQGCPFEPASASQMLSWAQDYVRWTSMNRRLEQARREAHIARGLVRQQRTELQDAWPTILRDDVPLAALLQNLKQWEATSRDVVRDRGRLTAARGSVEKLEQRLAELRQQQREIADRYATWLQQSPVEKWPIEQVGTLIDSIEHLRREDSTARRTSKQLSDSDAQLKAYQESVQRLAHSLHVSLDNTLPEVMANLWLEKLQQVREHKAQRIRLTASVEHRTRQLADWQTQQAELETRISALCASAGGGDAAGMASLMERVRQAEKLRAQQSELAAALEAYCGQEDIQAFQKRLEQADETNLTLQVQELSRDLTSLDEARKEADQRVGSLSQQIEHLANNQAAQRSLQQLHNQRGELAELSEQWVVERLAQALLSRSIERFSADHEPALLQLSRQFLSKLTGGRYTSIDHDNANPGSFSVRNALEESFPPARLSTGTREQLYLAIRMAFITHHNEQHEPLPVVMDDCFVNFDDQRTRLALEAIAHWDNSLQTILLSCHSRVVHILAEVAPDTRVIQLEHDHLTTAAELANDYSIS